MSKQKKQTMAQQQQMPMGGHAWADTPSKRPQQKPVHSMDSVRVSLIIGIVLLGLLLTGGMILGVLSIIDALRGHPGLSWQHFTAWIESIKGWLIAAGLFLVAVKFGLPVLEMYTHTALQRGEAAVKRAEARKVREQVKHLRDLRYHNEDYMPQGFIALSDNIGNYGQVVDAFGRPAGLLLPGNAQSGNSGINPKMLLDFMRDQQNAVDAEYYEEEDEAPLQIEAPKKILLSQQIERGLTSPDEKESVFGYPIDTYEPCKVLLFENEGNFVNSLFVVGQQSQGKSTIGTYFAALTVNHGGYLLVIDPDAEVAEQSLSSRLGPLKDFLLCEIADTPEKAERLLKIAEDEIDHPSDFPLLLLVDEFSLIMRQKKLGGKWQKVADLVASTVENYATRGRKRLRRAVVFGQISNASRTGGTELRDSCAQLVFQTPYKKALLVLQDADDDEIAELAPSLTPGTAIVLQKSDTYIMQFPFPDERGLQIIADVRRESDELAGSNEGLSQVQDVLLNVHEPEMNVDELALQADVRKVRLHIGKKTQDEIIYMLWGARKGGTQRYKEARARYQAIAMFIETGQWPEVREA